MMSSMRDMLAGLTGANLGSALCQVAAGNFLVAALNLLVAAFCACSYTSRRRWPA